MPTPRRRTDYCTKQAADCARAAVAATIAEIREAYLNLEQGWLRLAPQASESLPEGEHLGPMPPGMPVPK